jgi:hypothetical protein
MIVVDHEFEGTCGHGTALSRLTCPAVLSMTNIEWATWAAAAGTFAAALAAVGIAVWSHRKEVRQHKLRAWEADRDRAIEDADETRRLLIVIMEEPRALNEADLFGTIVHALVWHSRLEDPERAAQLLVRWRAGEGVREELESHVATLSVRIAALRAAEPFASVRH